MPGRVRVGYPDLELKSTSEKWEALGTSALERKRKYKNGTKERRSEDPMPINV
jgi:hypothetical protein